jgi:hypothetical protein
MINYGTLLSKSSYQLFYREIYITVTEDRIGQYRNIWKKEILKLRENIPLWESSWYTGISSNYNSWIYGRSIGYLGINGEYREYKKLNKIWAKEYSKII